MVKPNPLSGRFPPPKLGRLPSMLGRLPPPPIFGRLPPPMLGRLPSKPGAGLVLGFPPGPVIPGSGAGRFEPMPPGLGGRLIPPRDGRSVPGSGAGRVDGLLPEPLEPGRLPDPMVPGAGRVNDPGELGSLIFGRVDGESPPRFPGVGRVRFEGGLMLEIPPGAGRVVGIPPPKLGRFEPRLLPDPGR